MTAVFSIALRGSDCCLFNCLERFCTADLGASEPWQALMPELEQWTGECYSTEPEEKGNENLRSNDGQCAISHSEFMLHEKYF